jgi:Tol biopolymer transport system component
MKPHAAFAGFTFTAFLLLVLASGCTPSQEPADTGAAYDRAADSLRFEGEAHIRNIRQLTFGGNNAEAYWSFDDQKLIFQSDWSAINGQGCDQIFVMDPSEAEKGNLSAYDLVSTGKGRTTCSFFMPGDDRVIYASTHADSPDCPETVMFGQGRYVWPVYESYDIYIANADGSDPELLIGGPGYDAEPTVSPDGKYIIFTSTRSGDLELWRYEIETGELLQLTDGLGYDGGAFFSRDSQQIVWRASRPTGEDADVYRSLLEEYMVEPSALNIYVANIDGSNARQVTDLPGANWAPFFTPDGNRILFASNHHTMDQGGRVFAIFMINIDGTGLEQITHSGRFDAFPMFSYDGKKLVFASNRRADREDSADTNIFVADWVD